MELDSLLNHYLINRAALARECGRHPNWTLQWRHQGARPETVEPAIKVLVRCAKRLMLCDLEADDLGEILRESGFRITWVAKQLGISQQALSEQMKKGMSEERAIEITGVLHRAGRELLQKVSRLRKELRN